MGNLLMTFVVDLIAALIINLFLQSSQFDLIISSIGVLTFSGLTAYDTQKLKRLSQGNLEVLNELGFFNDKNKEKSENQNDAKPEGKEKSEKKPEK